MPKSLFPFQRYSRQRVQVWVRSPHPASRLRPLWQIVALLILASVAGLTLKGFWLGLRFIINPNTPHWIERYLPQASSGLGQAQPQSLAAITAELAQAGLSAGEMIELPTKQSSDWLLPILAPSQLCSAPCQHLVELRLYRPGDRADNPHLRLVDRLAVSGPTEAAAIAPLVGSVLEHPGSLRQLPLETVELLAEAENQQNWLTLKGHWQRGQISLSYGQLIQYDPAQARLRTSIAWSSPVSQDPYWLELDGVAPPELVINQSIGLDPKFLAYWLSGSQSSQIATRSRPISFSEPALSGSLITSEYGKALLQARSGLWSAAAKTLQSLKQPLGDAWTTDAEAQLGLIQLHSQMTQQQAERNWASDSQQILAYLIDGRWQAALSRLERSPEAYKEVQALLKQDSGRLWQRVTTALQVKPNQSDVQVWGMLILSAQQDRAAAVSWLERQDARAAVQKRFDQILVAVQPRPTPANPDPSQPLEQAPVTIPASASSRPSESDRWSLMGYLTSLYTVEPQSWFSPKTINPTAFDQWYRIQVNLLSNGQSGWRSPASALGQTPAQILWQQLQLDTQPQLDVLVETATGFRLATATVQGLQIQGDRVWLLAVSDSPLEASQAALALSAGRLTLLNPGNLLRQMQVSAEAEWFKAIQQIAKSEAIALPANLQVQSVDVTGDRQPDFIITAPESGPKGDLTGLLILSENGQVLYRNAAMTQAVATIRDRTVPPALLLQDTSSYQLVQWSAAAQQFQ
ncbi:MAG: hypothetical protein HC886_12220 [Leptolyngbyaceae cyanobacterium SM1_1_3]|nr:hypothetical protein [Leptolyngbyaceae cyanobacterium SM1_1_3]NJN02211.1 hypothetical protein [Leptolyngbyaceae cyanobacterium RM1_1_2]